MAVVLFLVLICPAVMAWNTNQSVIDHGYLTGLTDDDHEQYIRADGTRAFTGTQTGTISYWDEVFVDGTSINANGTAFFSVEHHGDDGTHTAITADSVVASGGVTGDSLDITTTIRNLPTGNGVEVSGGNLVSKVAGALTFDGSGNITATYATADDLTRIGASTTAAPGTIDRLARADHNHPVNFAATAAMQPVAAAASAGTSTAFMRADAVLEHGTFATGDHHTEYTLANGTRNFTGDQSFGGFAAKDVLAEAFTTGAEPAAGAASGRFWFNSTLDVLSYDDGAAKVRAFEITAGQGLNFSDTGGIRDIYAGAGEGLVTTGNAISIDTNIVPRLSENNFFNGQNTFRTILPEADSLYDLGGISAGWGVIYAGAIKATNGANRIFIESTTLFNGVDLEGNGTSSLGVPITSPFLNAYVANYYDRNGGPAVFPAGISSTTRGAGQSGRVSFTGGSKSANVSFTDAYSTSAVYSVSLTADTTAADPTFSNLAADGFTINLAANPGTTIVHWLSVRRNDL